MINGVSLFHYRPELFLSWILGVFFLFAFFKSIKSKWPENYFAFDSQTDPIVSKSLLHYLGYRMVPVYITCLFVGVSLDRSEIGPWKGWSAATRGVVGVLIGHLAITNFRGLMKLAQRRFHHPRDVGIAAVQLATIASVSIAAAVSLVGRTVMAPLIPKSNDLSVALWTGLVVAAMGGWLIDATKGAEKPIERLAKRSESSIHLELIDYAKQRCEETNTDWNFFFSVMLFENLQRPPWTRRIERMTSNLRSQGTYGIMQTTASRPLTDQESIDIALEKYLAGFQLRKEDPDDHSSGEYFQIQEALRPYNLSEIYADSIYEIYQMLNQRVRCPPTTTGSPN